LGGHPGKERRMSDPNDPIRPEFRSDIEHGHDDYTASELLEQSQLNAQAFLLGVFDTLRDDPALTTRLTSGIARTFLRGWDADREWEPVEILDALLTNFRALGGEVDSYEPENASPSAEIADLPDLDLADQLGVPATTFRPMLVVCQRLVEALGCELEWSHDASAGRVRLQVNEPSS
jgi:hypothetical protein